MILLNIKISVNCHRDFFVTGNPLEFPTCSIMAAKQSVRVDLSAGFCYTGLSNKSEGTCSILREQLTQGDVDKIKEEIEYRKLVVRKEAIEAVKEARAHGDLSENFEYHAAKKDKNQNESRIRYLERMLKTATVVSDHSAADEVGIDKTVEVYFEEDDETEVYKIVTSVRGDSLNGRISIESPMGKALLGHKAGDRVYIQINANAGYYVEIKSIQNTGESEEDSIRKY